MKPKAKRFYLTLTDQNGVVVDRFRLYLAVGANINPHDAEIDEAGCEGVGNQWSNLELCDRLLRSALSALKD